jgi:hypothetical protein
MSALAERLPTRLNATDGAFVILPDEAKRGWPGGHDHPSDLNAAVLKRRSIKQNEVAWRQSDGESYLGKSRGDWRAAARSSATA